MPPVPVAPPEPPPPPPPLLVLVEASGGCSEPHPAPPRLPITSIAAQINPRRPALDPFDSRSPRIRYPGRRPTSGPARRPSL